MERREIIKTSYSTNKRCHKAGIEVISIKELNPLMDRLVMEGENTDLEIIPIS